jgi:four helix bundle protein
MRLSEELRIRCKGYASKVVQFYAALPTGKKEIAVLGLKLLRSGTSVAAHSREASRARSTAEFCSKLNGLLQEADESHLWLELLNEDCGLQNKEIIFLLQETSELLAIFTTIVSKSRMHEKKTSL